MGPRFFPWSLSDQWLHKQFLYLGTLKSGKKYTISVSVSNRIRFSIQLLKHEISDGLKEHIDIGRRERRDRTSVSTK